MSTKKTIHINQDFFSLSGKSRKSRKKAKKKKAKKSEKSKNHTTSIKMRKAFMQKVQEYHDNKNKETQQKKDDEVGKKEFDSAFDRSLNFLSDLSNKKKSRKKRKKQKSPRVSLEIPKEFSNKNHISINVDNKPASLDKPNNSNIIEVKSINPPLSNKRHFKSRAPPPYSTLKGGSKPTYRQWMMTQKNKNNFSGGKKRHNIIINNKPEYVESERAKKLKMIKNNNNKKRNKKRMIKTKITTKTVKRKLGKSGKKIGVLVKSRQTRKNIQGEKLKLNKTSIVEIKRYLRKRNLIKAGSKAPNNVLTKLYEQSVLTGDVVNKSTDILVHNYLNE
jgi:hypothetical protein